MKINDLIGWQIVNFFKSYLGTQCREFLNQHFQHSFSSFPHWQLVLECESEELAQQLWHLLCSDFIDDRIGRLVHEVHIKVKGNEQPLYSFPPILLKKGISTAMIPNITSPAERDLRIEVDDFSGGAGIIRMSDHRGLYCNQQTLLCSGATPNDWIGQQMHLWFPFDELKKYLEALKKHQILTDFTHKAYLFDGSLCEFHSDVRIVDYRGEKCRLFKSKGKRPL